jgi:hypothetical protein
MNNIFLKEEVEFSDSISNLIQGSIAELDIDNEEAHVEVNEDPDFDLEVAVSEEDLVEAGVDKTIINEMKNLKTERKVVVKTRQQKLGLITQRTAMKLAQENKDPLYTKYRKIRDTEIALRNQILKKYQGKAKIAVKQGLVPKPKKTT